MFTMKTGKPDQTDGSIRIDCPVHDPHCFRNENICPVDWTFIHNPSGRKYVAHPPNYITLSGRVNRTYGDIVLRALSSEDVHERIDIHEQYADLTYHFDGSDHVLRFIVEPPGPPTPPEEEEE